MIDFIFNKPAAFIESIDSLVISDLHLGIENEIEKKGVVISSQDQQMLKELNELIDEIGAKNLIILGDIKHSINPSYLEINKIKSFFKELSKKVNIKIVKGNHDGSIERIIDAKIYSPKGTRIGEFYFNHGHTWPYTTLNGANYLLMGHLHPEIKVFIPNSEKKFHKCWLIGKAGINFKKFYDFNGKIIIFPAFNSMVGMSIREYVPGPLFRNGLIKMENMDVYLLNSIYLGKYSSFLKDGKIYNKYNRY
ncbi:MAG: metallophosphoesterase [Thermoplasmata archaeon]